MSTVLEPLVEHEGTQAPRTAAPTRGVPAIADRGARGPSLMQDIAGLAEGRQHDANAPVSLE